MRAALLLAPFAVAAVAACGGTADGGRTAIVFGITGGNIAPYSVTIQPNGAVEIRAPLGDHPRRHLLPGRVEQLARDVRRAHLASRRCTGVLPDLASRFVRAGGRTVTVHGSCEPRFERIWNELARAARYG